MENLTHFEIAVQTIWVLTNHIFIQPYDIVSLEAYSVWLTRWQSSVLAWNLPRQCSRCFPFLETLPIFKLQLQKLCWFKDSLRTTKFWTVF